MNQPLYQRPHFAAPSASMTYDSCPMTHPFTAIILAGGLGTRLRGVIGDAPKCMAPVAGRPFLDYLVDYLEQQGCARLVLSLGYRHEAVLDFLNTRSFLFPIDYVIEHEPLGTGGGIRKAMMKAGGGDICILNGDTFFDVPLQKLIAAHQSANATATLALKAMQNFERYGTVEIAESHAITAFHEKKPMAAGLINGGVYVLSERHFFDRPLPEKFSFEKDFLEKYVTDGKFLGEVFDGYFIDIGVPDDYERAQQDFRNFAGL